VKCGAGARTPACTGPHSTHRATDGGGGGGGGGGAAGGDKYTQAAVQQRTPRTAVVSLVVTQISTHGL